MVLVTNIGNSSSGSIVMTASSGTHATQPILAGSRDQVSSENIFGALNLGVVASVFGALIGAALAHLFVYFRERRKSRQERLETLVGHAESTKEDFLKEHRLICNNGSLDHRPFNTAASRLSVSLVGIRIHYGKRKAKACTDIVNDFLGWSSKKLNVLLDDIEAARKKTNAALVWDLSQRHYETESEANERAHKMIQAILNELE